MRLPLNLEVAALALGSSEILDVLATWAGDDHHVGLGTDLTGRLGETIQETARRRIGRSAFHQTDGAVALLRERPGPFACSAATHLATELLCAGRDGPALRFSRALDYQRITQQVAPDHVWAAFLVDRTPHGAPLTPHQIRHLAHTPLLPDIAEPALAELKRRGLPEPHRHFNGSALFGLLWSRLMSGDAHLPCTTHQGPEDARLNRLVVVARKLRAALVQWLLERADGDWISRVRTLLQATHSAASPLRHHDSILGFHWHAGHVSTNAATALPGSDDGSLFSERALLLHLFDALRRITASPVDIDTWASAGALAYLVIGNLAQQSLTQPATDAQGLDRFDHVYRGHFLRDPAEETLAPSERLVQAMRVGGVHWLEARLTPSKEPADKMRVVLDDAAARRARAGSGQTTRLFAALVSHRRQRDCAHWQRSMQPDVAHSLPALGFIFHFIRKPDRLPAPSRADLLPRLRHGALRASVAEEGHKLHAILDDPELARFFCGLDIAGVETHAPVEVFAPTIRELRSRSGMPRRAFLPGDHAGPIPSLALTCHAGEEFHHIIGGMRSMDEAMRFLKMEAGDRLGHGLAAGLNVTQWWSAQGGEVVLRRGQRLDDIVWFRSMLAEVSGFGHLMAALDDEISALSQEVYGVARAAPVLRRAWLLRQYPPERFTGAKAWFDDTRTHDVIALDPEAQECHKLHLFAVRCHRRQDELITVRCASHEIEATTAVQEVLLRRITEQRIAIEVNPTSNLSIACIDDLADHPIFRWHPPEIDPHEPRPPVIIATDNPGVCSTELVHEYAYLARAAISRGTPSHLVGHWLAGLRRQGLQFSFLRDRLGHVAEG